MIKITKKAWDRVYREHGKFVTEPQEDMPKIVELFKKSGIKRVLDLGCGSGRHIIFLAKNGFETYGIDIAEEGIKIAKDWLREEGLKAEVTVGDIYKKLPYPDNFFDAIISIKTLHHGRIEWIRRCIREIKRVLKPNGWIFITVKKKVPKKYIPKERLYGIEWIAPRTYVILGGPEKGLPHYEFNKKILLKEFKGFKIFDLWIDSENYYCLLGRLKQKVK